jgi:hypothetical protein
MSDKILLITEPDDSFLEGVRIFLYNLDPEQYGIFSLALLNFDSVPSTIVYNSNNSTNIQWLIDKLLKSDLIIFNANSENQQLVGYLCSKPNSYYFGELRDLSLVNNSVIFDVHQLKEILERRFNKNGKN